MLLRMTLKAFLTCALSAAGAAVAIAQAPAGGAEVKAASNDPVVRAMLAIKPTSPGQIFRVAMNLVDAGEPALALPMIDELVAKKMDDQVFAELIDDVGSAALMRLARVPELQPAAGQFVSAAFDGADRFHRDPERVKKLVDALKGANDYEHAVVVEQLRPAREAAVVALVGALADPARSAEHHAIRDTLVEIGTVSSAPLAAVLTTSDPRLAADVIHALGRLHDVTIADYLLAPALAPDAPPAVGDAARRAVAVYFGRVPTAEQGAARLRHVAAECRNRIDKKNEQPESESTDSRPQWKWDDASRQLTSKTISARAADIAVAVRYASDARRILPESQLVRRQYLSTLAQAIAETSFKETPEIDIDAARAVLAAAGAEDLEDLLAVSLDANQAATATVVAELLGEAGDESLLDKRTPQAAPLVRALSHPDRALRFAALGAIMRINPHRPFPGSSRVTEALAFFARSSGTPRALVGTSSAPEAGRVAGLMAELGYEPDATTSATDLLRMAQSSGDYEVIVVDSILARPVGGQLLQRLRADTRSAEVPIAIVAFLGEDTEAAERLARSIPACAAMTRTHNAAATEFELNRVYLTAGRVPVSREERHAQGLKSLGWIASLAGARSPLFDMRRLDAIVANGVNAPGMTEAAIGALGKFDTPRAQRTLVNLASRIAAPLALREAAVDAFADSVARNGTLLTSAEILKQYDRYNESETQNVETQKVLSRILDAIEARAQAEAEAPGMAARIGG